MTRSVLIPREDLRCRIDDRGPEVGWPTKLERCLANHLTVSFVKQGGEGMLHQPGIHLGEEGFGRRQVRSPSEERFPAIFPGTATSCFEESSGFGGITPASQRGLRLWSKSLFPRRSSHLSSARTSGSSSVGPSARIGFVLSRSRIGLFATNRNPSIHSCTIWRSRAHKTSP